MYNICVCCNIIGIMLLIKYNIIGWACSFMMKSMLIKKSCCDYPLDYQFNGIDIVKFICAFFVCIIHIQPFNVEYWGNDKLSYLNFGLQQCLCRIAVPFYFTASGFLLFRKTEFNNLNRIRIKNYCFKILRLLGIWTFLLFVGGSEQLWYLGALVLAVIILGVLIKKEMPMRWIVLISIVLFLIGLLGDSYYGFIEHLKCFFIPKLFIVGYETIFSTTRNGVFFGLIFVFIGALFAQKRIVINNIFAIVGLIASFMLMFLEVYLLKCYSHPKDFNMVLSLLPAIFFLFYLASHIKLKNRPVYGRLRVIGMLIFFTHLLVNYFVCLAIQFSNNKIGINLTAFQFIITIIFTTILAVIIERLSKTNRFHWLKYLFS